MQEHSPDGISSSTKPVFTDIPAFGTAKYNLRASQQRGLVFQRKVEIAALNSAVLDKYSDKYPFTKVLIAPWISYKDAKGKERVSQPDILLLDAVNEVLLVIECKLRHTRYAWAQYKHYEALLRLMYPTWEICGIEVCQYIDPTESAMELVTAIRPHQHDLACFLWSI